MAITLGELLIKLTAKTDAFQKGMSDAKRLAFDSSSDIVSSLGRIGESLGKLKFDNLNQVAASLSRIGGIIAGVSVGAATAAIAAAEHVAQQAKEIDKLSQSYGLSVQQISAFRVASQITGVSLDTITSGMSRLAKNAATVAEAVGGHTQKGAAAAFSALHISVTDSQGKLLPLNDLLGTIAEKFSRMQDSTTKTALAIQIFGKGGAALIPFLNEGKEGLERLRQVSDELGLTWTQADITAAKEFAEKIELLKLKGEAFEEQLSKGLYPALNNIVSAFTKVDSSGNSLAHTLGDGIGEVLKDLAESAEVLGHDFAVMYLTLKQLGDPTASPLSIFSNSDSVKSYEDALKSLDKQLNDVYRTLEKTHQSILSTFPTEGGDIAGRLSALNGIFGKTDAPPVLGGAQNIHKITEELGALSDETAKLLTQDSGDKYAQQILALNIQIGKLRDFGTDHQNLGNTFLTTISNQIDRLNDQINALNTQKLQDFAKSLQAPIPADIFKTYPAGNVGPRPQAPSSFLQYDLAIKQLEKLHAAHAINDEDYEKERTALQQGAQVFGQSLTAAQRYNVELDNLNRLLAANVITQDVFNRAVTQLGRISDSALKGAKAFFQDYADAAKETGRQVYDALNNAFDGINRNLADLVVKGKADWKSLLDDIETSIVKIGLQKVEGSLITTIGKALGVDLGGGGKPTGAAGSPLHTVVDNLPGIVPGGASQSGGGLLGGILGKIAGFFTGGGATGGGGGFDFGDFTGRASGGPVSAGVLYRVNENHTEYFKPGVNGRVLPLAPAGADGMGMGGFTYAPTYNISTPDADSFRKSPSQTLNQGLDAAQRASRRR